MRRFRLTTTALLFAAVLALAGCDLSTGSQGRATPTAAETGIPPDGDAPDDTTLAVTVEDDPFTLSDLSAMSPVQISAAGETYEGVPILDLLAAANVTGVLSITLVARDVVTMELGVEALTPESILALTPDNVLMAVVPGLSADQWLRDVVVIDTEPEARVALAVGENLFALEELRALQSVEVEANGESYEGVRILDLLSASGRADAVTFILVNRQGQSAEIPVKELTAESIMAFGQDDRLDAVLPGLADKYWLQDVVEIRTTP